MVGSAPVERTKIQGVLLSKSPERETERERERERKRERERERRERQIKREREREREREIKEEKRSDKCLQIANTLIRCYLNERVISHSKEQVK